MNIHVRMCESEESFLATPNVVFHSLTKDNEFHASSSFMHAGKIKVLKVIILFWFQKVLTNGRATQSYPERKIEIELL